MLRQLAQYHAKDPNNLFMVRLAQVKYWSSCFYTDVDYFSYHSMSQSSLLLLYHSN